MPTSLTSLLTQEDRDLIEGLGFPLGLRPDLHLIGKDGSVVFTIKGHQFYRATLSRLGMLDRLSSVKTRTDLYRLKQEGLARLALAAEHDVLAELAANRIPAQRRDIVQSSFGTPKDFDEAYERLCASEAAGANVIPASFKRKHRD